VPCPTCLRDLNDEDISCSTCGTAAGAPAVLDDVRTYSLEAVGIAARPRSLWDREAIAETGRLLAPCRPSPWSPFMRRRQGVERAGDGTEDPRGRGATRVFWTATVGL
jgi:hypothetical protein